MRWELERHDEIEHAREQVGQGHAFVDAQRLDGVKGGRELLLEHRVEGRLDVERMRVSRACVHAVFVNEAAWLAGRVACLQDVEGAAHVAMRELEDGGLGAVIDAAVLGGDDAVDAALDLRAIEGREPEARAATLDGRDDFVDVVADNAEAHVACVLLHDAAQCRLGGLCHRIGLVEDDELEGVRLGAEHVACARKRLDLATDDVDAAVVGRI